MPRIATEREWCRTCNRYTEHLRVHGRLVGGVVQMDASAPQISMCTKCTGERAHRTATVREWPVGSVRRPVRHPPADRCCVNCRTPLARDGWAKGTRGQTACCKRPEGQADAT